MSDDDNDQYQSGGATRPGPAPSESGLMTAARFMGGTCGALVITLGVMKFMTLVFDITEIVTATYQVVFGVLIILSEMRSSLLLKQFHFLHTAPGRGLFFIFVAGLAVGSKFYEVGISVALASVGVLYLFSYCICSSEDDGRGYHSGV